MSTPVLLAIILLLILLIVGIPVPASFFGTTLFLIVTCGYTPEFLVPYAYSKTSSYVLLAIPLFIIAGGIIERSDLGAHLVNFVNMLVGRVKGSLGMVAVIACALFGSVTGSACATMSVIGSIMWPRMEAAGYSKGKSAALISSSCLLGGLIPPQLPDDHVRHAVQGIRFKVLPGGFGPRIDDDRDVLHCLLVHGPQGRGHGGGAEDGTG